MIQTTPTKLSLDAWARIMGINPLHFAGVQIDEIQRTGCDSAFYQHEWQTSDAVSREEIARAIAQSESMIEDVLGYRLLPSWETDEWNPTVRPNIPEMWNLGHVDVRGYPMSLQARWGHFVSGGIESREIVSEGEAIVYASTRPPADYADEGTVGPVVTVALDPQEIQIFYPGKAGDDAYRIEPTSVEISAGSVTITFARHLAVTEDIIESMDLKAATGGNRIALGGTADNFLATVDVYRVYNDPQQQVSFLWQSVGNCSVCGGSGTSCASCGYATQTGCLALTADPKFSRVVYRPATWSDTDQDFTDTAWAVAREPDLVRLYYLAGLRDKNRPNERITMAGEWQRAVAYLSAGMLTRQPCNCAQNQWRHWSEDLALVQGGLEQMSRFQTTRRILNNPFGTSRGAVNAWQMVQQRGRAIARWS